MATIDSKENQDPTVSQNDLEPQAGVANGEPAEQEQADQVFNIVVKLPHHPGKMELTVSSQEQVQDLRTSIIEHPDTFQYSCFHLEHNGERINDFIELSDVKGLAAGSEILLREDPYTEKEARVHMLRVRDLIGASGERIEPLYGLCYGTSLHDSVVAAATAGGEQGADSKADIDGAASTSLNYDFNAPPSLQTVMRKTTEPAPKTVKTLALSEWNPPPLHLRQRGHLMYLTLTTLEGNQYYITSHVSSFFVNKSSNHKFDPNPKPKTDKGESAHSLLSLITKLSEKFGSAFKQLQEYNSRRDPLANFQITNVLPAAPWIVSQDEVRLADHRADGSRTQEMWLNAGNETAENMRDWNEEFQSTKELPKEQVHERVFRERVTNKLFADYTESASRGAMLVARGELAPLNPTEQKDAQIFVHNNVFYSFGADGMGTFATEGGDEAARVAVGKDVNGVRLVSQLDIDSLFTPGTVVVDYMGRRIVGQSIVPGIFKQRDPGEHQIDYGGVEGRDVVTTNEAFVEPFSKLSKALKIKKHNVWDKEGKEHTLEGSVETKGLLGTDGRKYVLDLYRLTPLDVNWLKEYWVDGKDGETKPKEQNYPHRMAVIRQELVDAFWRTKLSSYVTEEYSKRKTTQEADSAEQSKPEETSEKQAPETEEKKEENKQQERIDISNFTLAFNPDVYSGQVPATEADKSRWESDEKQVEELCNYLRDFAIPDLLKDLQEGDVGFPMDGTSLSRLLHKRGINIRYLGWIASKAKQAVTGADKRLDTLAMLSVQEVIARSFKHVANRYMRPLPVVFVPACITHLLNCLLGTRLNKEPKASLDAEMREWYPDVDCSFSDVTPASLRAEVEEQAVIRFRYSLEPDWQENVKHMQMLREVSIKLGLQLKYRHFQFSPEQSTTNGASTTNGHLDIPAGANSNANRKKKEKEKAKKKALRESSSSESLGSQVLAGPPTTFSPEDIANMIPIVKDSTPRSNLAEEALEAGRISIGQKQTELGQELLFEGMSLHEQIYGVLHPEVARVYHTLSMLYYQLGDNKLAVDLARKAAIVSERVLGLDASETILSYLNLALFEHSAGRSIVALGYVRHALDLWKIAFGKIDEHPDAITTINNGAVMLQALRKYSASRTWFEKSRQVAIDLTGKDTVYVATLSFQLAQALALDQRAREAVSMMKEARDTFGNKLGPDSKNTQEATEWVEQLLKNAVNIETHAKNVQQARLRRPGGRPGDADSGSAGILRSGLMAPAGQSASVTAPPQPRMGDNRDAAVIAKEIEELGKSPKAPKTSAKKGGKTPVRR